MNQSYKFANRLLIEQDQPIDSSEVIKSSHISINLNSDNSIDIWVDGVLKQIPNQSEKSFEDIVDKFRGSFERELDNIVKNI